MDWIFTGENDETGLLARLPDMIEAMRAVGQVGEKEYYISNVATCNNCRSLGIGTRLIREAEATARGLGAERMTTDTEAGNSSAIIFFEKMGFSILSESSFNSWRGTSLHFYRMSKDL